MKKRKQRKLEKKRRVERMRRREKTEPLAYHGNKYRTDDLVPVVYCTEVGIYESFVMKDRQITDHDVRAALEWLIRGIRGGTIAVASQGRPSDEDDKESNHSLITWNIRRHWDEHFAEQPFPGRDRLIGVLRTILGSIETWGTISPTSRGYLRYLEGFMGKLGVHCRRAPPDLVAALEGGTADFDDFPAEEEEEEEESELLLAGRAWAEQNDADAGVVFRALADEMIADGEAAEVAETGQQLMGETYDRRVIDELGGLSLRAQQHLRPAPSRLRGFLGRLIGR